MPEVLTGGCLCGAVRYRVEVESTAAMHCYCRDCQRITGSQAATFVSVPAAQLEIEGETASFSTTGESGRSVKRFFCSQCGSQLYSTAEAARGAAFVKAGTLDDPNLVQPQVAIWTKSKPNWAEHSDDLVIFEGNPRGN